MRGKFIKGRWFDLKPPIDPPVIRGMSASVRSAPGMVRTATRKAGEGSLGGK